MTQQITPNEETPAKLSPIKQSILDAVAQEVPAAGVFRNRLNAVSLSFPLNYRTLANHDAMGMGPREFEMIGGRRFYSKSSLLENLREYLSKPEPTPKTYGR